MVHSVTFKSDIPKNEVQEIGDSQHSLSVYCGQYISIMSEKTKVYLSKKQHWSQLMDLESGCINREVIKFRRQDELLEWRNKCFESKSFCTPPDNNAIDFSILWN